MLHGAVGGSDLEPIPPTDSDGIHRDPGRQIRIVVDFERAAAKCPSLYVPRPTPDFDRPKFTADVRLEGARLRQIAFAAESQRHCLELSDFGVSLDDFDWTRLPDLRRESSEAP
jgi:hypothetical protein